MSQSLITVQLAAALYMEMLHRAASFCKACVAARMCAVWPDMIASECVTMHIVNVSPVNVMQAAGMMASGVGTALPHLRVINPQVATILSTAAAKGSAPPLLPRQGGPRAVPHAEEASNTGISSFAFQVQLPFFWTYESLRCKHRTLI